MTFITGNQVECLYEMPASGAATTAAVATVMSGTTAANPAYQLPTGYFAQQTGSGAGRSLLIKGGGWWQTPTATRTTSFQIGLNTTVNTGAIALLFGKTGTITTPITTNQQNFDFEVIVTCTTPGQSATAGTLNAVGWVEYGNGNNVAAGTIGTYGVNNASRFLIGTPQTGVAWVPTTPYWLECSNTWDAVTNVPTITLTNFLIFGI